MPMAPTPRPEGWKGGSEDFLFVRTLDGRLSVNEESDEEFASDFDARRNARHGFEEADLNGSYGGA